MRDKNISDSSLSSLSKTVAFSDEAPVLEQPTVLVDYYNALSNAGKLDAMIRLLQLDLPHEWRFSEKQKKDRLMIKVVAIDSGLVARAVFEQRGEFYHFINWNDYFRIRVTAVTAMKSIFVNLSSSSLYTLDERGVPVSSMSQSFSANHLEVGMGLLAPADTDLVGASSQKRPKKRGKHRSNKVSAEERSHDEADSQDKGCLSFCC